MKICRQLSFRQFSMHWKWVDIGWVMQLQSYVNIWNGFEIMHTECIETQQPNTSTHPQHMTIVLYCIALHFYYTFHIAQCHWITIVKAYSIHIQIVAFVQWHKSLSFGNWLEYGCIKQNTYAYIRLHTHTHMLLWGKSMLNVQYASIMK